MPTRTLVGVSLFDDGPHDGAWREVWPHGALELHVVRAVVPAVYNIVDGLSLPCRARRERMLASRLPTREVVMVEARFANAARLTRYEPEPTDCLSLSWCKRIVANYPPLAMLPGRFGSFTDIAEAYFYVTLGSPEASIESGLLDWRLVPRRVIWRWEPLPE
jgi:hypothetical protein